MLELVSEDLEVDGERPRNWERVSSKKRLRSREGPATDRVPRGLVVGSRQVNDPRLRWEDANADGLVCCEVRVARSKRRQVS